MIVGWDNDGVLHNFLEGVCDYLDTFEHKWNHSRNHGAGWNDFLDLWGMSLADFKKVCDDGVDAGYIFNNNVRPNAVAAVNAVKRMGHYNLMITDRQFGSTPASSHNRTFEWINDNGFQFDEVIFSADKTIKRTDIFVEDKLENYDAITAAGTECWLITRPWNNAHGKDDRLRIQDVSQYPVRVSKRAARLSLVN